MRFSERKGYKPVSQVLQRDDMGEALRNSLWNVLDLVVWQREGFLWKQYGDPEMKSFSAALWFQHFKKPVDTRPNSPWDILKEIREQFFKGEWYEVYDLLEWILNCLHEPRLNSTVNAVLERELAGYRFVGGQFTDLTDKQEIGLLEEALTDSSFPGVRAHLQAALRLLSNRENPDYRNSIKESISAVESMAQVVAGMPKATLGDALAVLEKRGHLHPALKQGFSKLYGYTSNEDGIRHAMLEEPNITAADAKFFLLSCTSFINYLKAKM